jgi:hypothetical protein
MRSRSVIVRNVSSKHATQMSLAQNDDVIEALARRDPISRSANGFCQARRRSNDFGRAHAGDAVPKLVSMDGIVVAQQTSRSRVVRKGVDDLLRRSCGGGMFGDHQGKLALAGDCQACCSARRRFDRGSFAIRLAVRCAYNPERSWPRPQTRAFVRESFDGTPPWVPALF